MRRSLVVHALWLTGLLLGCTTRAPAEALEKWGPFRGQIVDVETGKPIAGAVVLVVWWEDVPNPIQQASKFYDTREGVTDANGRFEVPRLTPPFFTFRIRQPQVTYFAPGYVPHGEVVTPPDGKPFVAPTVIQMRRLKTREELLKKSRGYPSGIPEEKMREFLKVINIERGMLGLRPEGERQP